MVLRIWIISFLAFCLLGTSHAATLQRGPSESVKDENDPVLKEWYRIELGNSAGDAVQISLDQGGTWTVIGEVLFPATRANPKGYTASKWVSAGEVAASAVNAIHINVGYTPKYNKGAVVTILPKEQLRPSEYYEINWARDASIYTSIPAGTSIFGGGWSPFVGNKVYFRRGSEILESITSHYEPQVGDSVIIIVERPIRYPREIVFENRFGGQITMSYPFERPKIIGEVLQPIVGVGRFQGTEWAGSGRIRANHAGVIDISTSHFGKTGGFQIVPANHGMSPEMVGTRQLTQWMVVGPPSVTDDSYEGVAPLFRYYLQPVYRGDSLMGEDWKKKVSRHFLVQVRYKNGRWKPMPIFELHPDRKRTLPKWAGQALDDVTHFRILFPASDYLYGDNLGGIEDEDISVSDESSSRYLRLYCAIQELRAEINEIVFERTQ